MMDRRAPSDPLPTRHRSFERFFDHYLREHGRPETRALHFAGTGLAALLLAAALTNRRWRYLLSYAPDPQAPLPRPAPPPPPLRAALAALR